MPDGNAKYVYSSTSLTTSRSSSEDVDDDELADDDDDEKDWPIFFIVVCVEHAGTKEFGISLEKVGVVAC